MVETARLERVLTFIGHESSNLSLSAIFCFNNSYNEVLHMKLNPKILLSIWIYIGWFGCVYFGKLGWSVASIVFPLISWLLLRKAFHLDLKLATRLLTLATVGLVFDTVCARVGLINLNPTGMFGFLPLWMISIWLLFITSMPLMQSVLQKLTFKKYILAGGLGAIFGPLSYRAGSQFGTLLIEGTTALSIYAIFWGLYFPMSIYWLEKRK